MIRVNNIFEVWPIILAQIPSKGALESSSTGYIWDLLKMLAALVVVCIIAYLLLRYGLKRLVGPKTMGRNLRLVDRCMLASGKAICIVEATGRFFLIGVSDGGISLLAELDSKSLVELQDNKTGRRFFDFLDRDKKERGD